MTRPRFASALALGASLAVLAVNFRDLFDRDRIPFYRDLLFFFIPFKHFLGESLRRGEVPLWNPLIYMGTPFLAGWQTGVFYPPSLLLALPFPVGFNVFVLAHYGIALVGAYALFRERGLSITPSTIGALVYSLGGYLISMLNVTNGLQAAAWAPWIALAWALLLRTRTASAVSFFVLMVALQILAGQPETLLMTLTVLAVWTIAQHVARPTEAIARLAVLGCMVALSAGLVAFQILPTVEYLHESVRNAGFSLEEAAQSSLEPLSLLQLVVPPTSIGAPRSGAGQPWLESLYIGLVPSCLAIVGFAGGRDRYLWASLALLAILFGLGTHTWFFGAVYSLAPWLVSKFRYPEKLFFVVHLSATVAAAEGSERLLALAGRSLFRSAVLGFVLAALVAVDLVDAHSKLNPTLSWSALTSRPPLADAAELRRSRQRIFHYDTVAPFSADPVPGLEQWWSVKRGTKSLDGFIEDLWPTLFMNGGMLEGIGTVGGADGLTRDSDATLRRILSIVPRETSLKLLGIYAVRFLIGPVPLESSAIEPIARPDSPYFAYRVRNAAPLAYLADRLWLATAERDAFNRLISPSFRVGRDATVDALPPDWTDGAAEDDSAGTTEIVSYENDSVRVKSRSDRRTLLVLSESYFPGWEVTVDGRSQTILRANAFVRGVALEAGSHVVEFRYRPTTLRRGLVISAVSAVMLTGVLAFVATRRPT